MNAELILQKLEEFNELNPIALEVFCFQLGPDMPEDQVEWDILYSEIESLEEENLIEVNRDSEDYIESLAITDEGLERLTELS